MRSHTRKSMALAAALLAMVVAGCGGAGDEVGRKADAGAATNSNASAVKLALVGYAVPKVGFDKVIPAFNETPEGKGVTFSQSYGASGDQSRKVESGLPDRRRELLRRARRHAARQVRPGRRRAGTRTSTRASRSARS